MLLTLINGAHLRHLGQPEATVGQAWACIYCNTKLNHTVVHGTFTAGALTMIALPVECPRGPLSMCVTTSSICCTYVWYVLFFFFCILVATVHFQNNMVLNNAISSLTRWVRHVHNFSVQFYIGYIPYVLYVGT